MMQFKFQTFNNRYPKLESDASTLAQLLKETDSVTRVSVCYGESKILTKLFCITKYLVKENHVGLLLSAINFFFFDFHDAAVCYQLCLSFLLADYV